MKLDSASAFRQAAELPDPDYEPRNPRARVHCDSCGAFVATKNVKVLSCRVGPEGREWVDSAYYAHCGRCGKPTYLGGVGEPPCEEASHVR